MGRMRQDFLRVNGVIEAQGVFHARAAATRDAVFGRQVFVRGVVEVSNYCRQNCHYCAMRRDNQQLARYRLAADEVADLIIHHRPASITDIDIQAGEDPVAVREVVLPLVRELRRHTDLGITLCLGTLTSRQYDELREAGGEYYILKIETGNAKHYRLLEAPGTLARRVEAIRYLARTGWKVSSGLIIGLPGQTAGACPRIVAVVDRIAVGGVQRQSLRGRGTNAVGGQGGRVYRANTGLRGVDAIGLTALDHSRRQRHETGFRERLRARLSGGGESRDDQPHAAQGS